MGDEDDSRQQCHAHLSGMLSNTDAGRGTGRRIGHYHSERGIAMNRLGNVVENDGVCEISTQHSAGGERRRRERLLEEAVRFPSSTTPDLTPHFLASRRAPGFGCP